MPSTAKIDANRRNALLSTGPKTAAGKSTVAKNAVKHGLLSREVVLREEDRSAFRALALSLCDALRPEGALEILLVDRIVAAAWRLRRIQVIETDLCAPDEGQCVPPGTRFIQDCHGANSLVKLSRYEAAIERSLYRALHELERLQHERSSKTFTKPTDADICLPVTGH